MKPELIHDIKKATVYRTIAFGGAALVTMMWTGNFKISIFVAVSDFVLKWIFYLLFEICWKRLRRWWRKRKGESNEKR